ncbi:hypothetical protein PP175_26945 (plasmid) [Aneurinibacillus sp. Ricciae_BoGa-3]|uniref:OmpL47-type beta-barrel domain-containing protein n=1 Tax=Aneurinibacillus sp. Ricciae_BoGa-3 TaxID=3022697 RepID=UPI00234074FD|nr:hypothetical protein [Aneurinibacillus sp. Ricciae_BoGa-3]WCK57676.1 hypothetical protein PP175_26945 [Aneurinibacillus sp. Ricciae_BoGa-3]
MKIRTYLSLKRIKIHFLLFLIVLSLMTTPFRSFAQSSNFTLTATPNPNQNGVQLNWNSPYVNTPTTYMVYRVNSSGSWESIPSKSSVKVLNIYPDGIGITNTGLSGGQVDLDGKPVPDSGILKTWLEKENINSVSIDTVSLSSFNANPSQYLKKVNGAWNYDAVFYGMWNLLPDVIYPNDIAVEYLRAYIKDGGGFMTSHHTIGYRALDRGVNKLANELGVEIFSNQTYSKCPDYAGTDAYGTMFSTVSFLQPENVPCDYSSYWPSGDKVEIVKKGLLTEFPFKVGDLGQIYQIPYHHGLNVFAKGEVWMKTVNPTGFYNIPFKEFTVSPRTGASGTNNFYVHTFNNTAIINSGHSFPQISQAEVRIIANTLFYLSQTTPNLSWLDRIGMDTAAPNAPAVSVSSDRANGETLSIGSTDNGVTSQYLVKARTAVNEIQSNTASVTLTAGIKGYSYVIDHNPNTVPDSIVDTTSTAIEAPRDKAFYVHVVAIDNAGNVSPVTHFHYLDNQPPSLTLSVNTSNWMNNSHLTIHAVATDSGAGVLRIQLPDGNYVNQSIVDYNVGKNGTYSFTAYDNAGNAVTKPFTVSNFDTTAPTSPTIQTQSNWINVSSVNVTILSGSDSQSGVNRTEYKLEGATNQGYVTYAQPFSITNEGVTKITPRTIDNVGNISNETISYVRIDRTAPVNTSITIQLKP